MLRAEQHGAAVPIVATLTIALVAVACSASSGDTSSETPPGGLSVPSLSAKLPTEHLDGMHTTQTIVGDAVAASLDAVHPDEVRAVLTSAGFVGAWERIYAGRVGVFSRVALRAWQFRDALGATAYATWLDDNGREWIGAAHPIGTGSLPGSVHVVMHDVTGCCHEETPIYLASWRRGAVVWTVRASGARIRTAPLLDLVSDIEGKV
jgi:hypothetical protein